MRRSKWLFVLVLILLLCNIILFSVWYFLDVQGKVKHYIERTVSRHLNGVFQIGQLSINDKQIIANRVTYAAADSTISFSIKQVGIKYNLLRVLFSQIKLSYFVDRIDIREPNVTFFYKHTPKKKPLNSKIPDIKRYFKELHLEKGTLVVHLETAPGENDQKLVYEDRINNIKIRITNSTATEYQITGYPIRSGFISAEGLIRGGEIDSTKLVLHKFCPNVISYPGLTDATTTATVNCNYSRKSDAVQITGVLEHSSVQYQNHHVLISLLTFKGNNNLLSFEFIDGSFDNNPLAIKGSVKEPVNSPLLTVQAITPGFDLSGLQPDLSATYSGSVDVLYDYHKNSARLEANGSLPAITYKDLTINNTKVNAVYNKGSIVFQSTGSNWNQQAVTTAGSFNFAQHELQTHLNMTSLRKDSFGLETELDAQVNFTQKYPTGHVRIEKLSYTSEQFHVDKLTGYLTIDYSPLIKEVHDAQYTLTSHVSNGSDLDLSVTGELLKPLISAEIQIRNRVMTSDIGYLSSHDINAILSGNISACYDGNAIKGKGKLHTSTTNPLTSTAKLDFTFDHSFDNKLTHVSVQADSSDINGQPVSLSLNASFNPAFLSMQNITINNELYANIKYNVQNNKLEHLDLNTNHLNTQDYLAMLTAADRPDLHGFLSLLFLYDAQTDVVKGSVTIDSLSYLSLKQVTSTTNIMGTTRKIAFQSALAISDKQTLSGGGTAFLADKPRVELTGEIKDVLLQNVVQDKNIYGNIKGYFKLNAPLTNRKSQSDSLYVNLTGKNIGISSTNLDSLSLSCTQYDNVLTIDRFNAVTDSKVSVSAKGALDFDLSSLSLLDGDNTLSISIRGDVLRQLARHLQDIEQARGNTDCQMHIRASEGGLYLKDGHLVIAKGRIKLADQPETIAGIELKADFNDNQLTELQAQGKMGDGNIFIRNKLDTEGDNFYIGNVNLGYMYLWTDEHGLQINLPRYMPANTTAKAVLTGWHEKYAYIKGPFDDMHIDGNIYISNCNLVYPSNTKNILQMISLRKAKTEEEGEEIPMPFTLDLLLQTDSNVRYITYPADFLCLPKSYLHVTYDGSSWHVPEADLSSEEGKLDFYGTTFKVEFIKVYAAKKQNIVTINGVLTKRAADGSLITLDVYTDPKKGTDVLHQIEFKLTSDNPEDKSITQILSKLRYNRSLDDLTPEQQQNLLQDEAMQLIGTSVSTAYFGLVLNPVENAVRKLLHLDTFTINSGFIQNLFMQYGSTQSQDKVVFSDFSNLNTDIQRFSSSILLNNLALDMGKYVTKDIFVDYQLQLQETTNIAKKTGIAFYHNASVRTNLPWQLRLIYTFSLRPEGEKNSHEVMLQRSFRF